MSIRFACQVALGLCLPWTVGCQSMTETVRGQNPSDDALYASYGQAAGCPAAGCPCGPSPAGGAVNHWHHSPGCGHGRPSAACGPYGYHGGFVPGGYHPGPCGPDCGCYPKHHTWYSYDVPDDGEFVYPPANQLPGVVQYPYYTLRGPSDFFMK